MAGALDELISQKKIDDMDEVTVRELRQIFGSESVRRGLSYMASLSDAEVNYREASNGEQYIEGMEQAFDAEIDEDSPATEAAKRWQEAMENGSLGIDKETTEN